MKGLRLVCSTEVLDRHVYPDGIVSELLLIGKRFETVDLPDPIQPYVPSARPPAPVPPLSLGRERRACPWVDLPRIRRRTARPARGYGLRARMPRRRRRF